MGIGGSLDVLTGAVPRAPRVFLRLHLEFAYRLLREPSRLIRQRALFTFLRLLVRGRFGARSEFVDVHQGAMEWSLEDHAPQSRVQALINGASHG